MAIFNDTFTDTNNTDLSAHTPDTGTSWTQIIDVGSNELQISGSDTLDSGAVGLSDGALYTADATYPSADYEAQVTVVAADSGDDPCVLAIRIQDANNMYAVYFNNDTSQLYKRTTAGGWATVGSAGAGVVDGSVVKLKIVGTTLSFIDDGDTVLSETVTDHSNAGKAGIGMGAVIISGDDGSFQEFDNFVVTDLGAGGGGEVTGKAGIGLLKVGNA